LAAGANPETDETPSQSKPPTSEKAQRTTDASALPEIRSQGAFLQVEHKEGTLTSVESNEVTPPLQALTRSSGNHIETRTGDAQPKIGKRASLKYQARYFNERYGKLIHDKPDELTKHFGIDDASWHIRYHFPLLESTVYDEELEVDRKVKWYQRVKVGKYTNVNEKHSKFEDWNRFLTTKVLDLERGNYHVAELQKYMNSDPPEDLEQIFIELTDRLEIVSQKYNLLKDASDIDFEDVTRQKEDLERENSQKYRSKWIDIGLCSRAWLKRQLLV
jgi:hypothetical protein